MLPDDRDSQAKMVREVWARIAPFWDGRIAEGNDFQLELIMPATDRLLAIRAGERVLDVACGNGNYARRLGRAGAKVLAVDVSAPFIEAARARTVADDGDIEYRVVDAGDEGAMASLGAASFDAVVCSMALMDMPEIDAPLRGIRTLLAPGGRFVFSLPHPCFSSNNPKITAELVNDGPNMMQHFGLAISSYITPTSEMSTGIIGQPEPHPFFHRPLSLVLSKCFATGFVLDGFEEPTYSVNSGAKNAFSRKKRPELPPAIVARMRPC